MALEHALGELLGGHAGLERDREVGGDAVGREHDRVARLERDRLHPHLRQVEADDAAEHDRRGVAGVGARAGAHEAGLDVADAGPLHRPLAEVEPRQRHHGAARLLQLLVAALEQLLVREVDVGLEHPRRSLGGVRRPVAVAEAVDHRDEAAALRRREHRHVARAPLARMRQRRHAALQHQRPRGAHAAREFGRAHITSVTFVPCPGAVSMSKSSTSRLAPGSPSPSPLPLV